MKEGMKHICPNTPIACPENIIRDGFFKRREDSKIIQRYRCRACGKRFSAATRSPLRYQKKRRINSLLAKYLASNNSLRRSAWLLGVSRRTIERRVPLFGYKYRRLNQRYLESRKGTILEVQLDDLITKENSKLKPVSISMLVEAGTRRILAVEVSRIPAFGHLAKVAVKKYGKRDDEHPQGLERLFQVFSKIAHPEVLVKSDEHQRYGQVIRKYLPRARHRTFRSERATVAGQGELKKGGFDPIFTVNHSCAMLRANINRLNRRTWNTSKSLERLRDHLEIFIWFYNQRLLPPALTPF